MFFHCFASDELRTTEIYELHKVFSGFVLSGPRVDPIDRYRHELHESPMSVLLNLCSQDLVSTH